MRLNAMLVNSFNFTYSTAIDGNEDEFSRKGNRLHPIHFICIIKAKILCCEIAHFILTMGIENTMDFCFKAKTVGNICARHSVNVKRFTWETTPVTSSKIGKFLSFYLKN